MHISLGFDKNWKNLIYCHITLIPASVWATFPHKRNLGVCLFRKNTNHVRRSNAVSVAFTLSKFFPGSFPYWNSTQNTSCERFPHAARPYDAHEVPQSRFSSVITFLSPVREPDVHRVHISRWCWIKRFFSQQTLQTQLFQKKLKPSSNANLIPALQ